jgi:hypothetical protein
MRCTRLCPLKPGVTVFDETNGSQVEKVDLGELDDEEAPCIALRNMTIGDV